MADPTARGARETLDRPRLDAESAGEAARRSANRLGDQVREAAESFVSEQRERIATAAHDLAEALRHTADSLEHDDQTVAARYADEAAARIDRLSDTMRRQQLSDMLSTAEEFARRQPALFVTGAAAVGFLLGRLLWAPAARNRETKPVEGFATTGGDSIYHAAAAEPQDEERAGYGPHFRRV